MLGIRSNTKVTERVLDDAPDLLAVGCFCIGTNQIDLAAAAERGIAVFNAPYSNTRSVVELVIGEIIALARRLPEKTQRMHDGIWDKSATGQPRGARPHARHRRLRQHRHPALQPRRGARLPGDLLRHRRPARPRQRPPGAARLDELLEKADVVTLHVDGRPGNAGLFGAEQFARMKPRSMFINASRGMVVDDVALREHILSGHIAGAALDVFPVEPKAQGDEFESALRGLDNVILTPHVGGSTQEAQEEIGYFVSGKLAAFVARGQHRAVGEPARGRRRRRSTSGVPDRAPAPQRARACSPRSTRCSPTSGPTSPRSTSPPAASRATSSPTSTPSCPTSRARRPARGRLHDLAADLRRLSRRSAVALRAEQRLAQQRREPVLTGRGRRTSPDAVGRGRQQPRADAGRPGCPASRVGTRPVRR